MRLNAAKVRDVFMYCLFTDGENTDSALIVDGARGQIGFHPERLQERADTIAEWLQELPDDFHAEKGGGLSFLNAALDKHGTHWGEHQSIDQLFTLGVGAGKAKYCLPREMWGALPGGMPYLVVLPLEGGSNGD